MDFHCAGKAVAAAVPDEQAVAATAPRAARNKRARQEQDTAATDPMCQLTASKRPSRTPLSLPRKPQVVQERAQRLERLEHDTQVAQDPTVMLTK